MLYWVTDVICMSHTTMTQCKITPIYTHCDMNHNHLSLLLTCLDLISLVTLFPHFELEFRFNKMLDEFKKGNSQLSVKCSTEFDGIFAISF